MIDNNRESDEEATEDDRGLQEMVADPFIVGILSGGFVRIFLKKVRRGEGEWT